MTRLKAFPLLEGGPFRFGLITALGVLVALALGSAVITLRYSLTLIFAALFISLGLYPLVRWLERWKLSRGGAVLAVAVGFLVVVALLIRFVVPILVEEGTALVRLLPSSFDAVGEQEWFRDFNGSLGGALTPLLEWLETSAADPNVWLAIGGGAVQVGYNVVNGTFAVVFVVVLTLYFVAGHEVMKSSLYALVPASRRESFADISETIIASVGKYLSGMSVLALFNAIFTFILLSVAGVRYAAVLAVLAFPITLIPLVGSAISTAIITVVSLFTSPSTAIVVFLVMLAYMQVEAYVLTPRVVGKAISIPGSLVLIGAMVGGTLLGLLGALIACPTTASILLIIKKVVIPQQNAK
ncbi:putative PurR-regulated permease PerM [Arthrobacter bambusae]|uniref:PurR-regulated permease PerM n=1 Tax=Arthrobacter bambusae TaxID=1338426 RepID=A0ABV2PBX7_9MICC